MMSANSLPLRFFALIGLQLCLLSGAGGEKATVAFHLLHIIRPSLSDVATAARLAVEQINNRSDLLQGYRVELVEATSDECNTTSLDYTQGLVSFVKSAVHSTDLNVVGVVGLLCSAVTDGLSPVIGRKGSDLIQISGSTSPILRDSDTHPRLYRVATSSAIYADVVVELMRKNSWTRISYFHDIAGTYYTSTAEATINLFNSQEDLTITYSRSLDSGSTSSVRASLEGFIASGRIAFVSLSPANVATFLCTTLQLGITWPDYVYILQDYQLQDLLGLPADLWTCDMMKAIEGVVLLNYRFENDQNTTLVSGETYAQLQRHNEKGSPLWNLIYDEVWSFGLALNGSQAALLKRGFSLSDYQLGNGQISDIVEDTFKNVTFQGASGVIRFSSGKEVDSRIDLFQITNNKSINFGQYSGELMLLLQNLSFPLDRFPVVTLPFWVTIAIFAVFAICCVLTTVILFLYLCYRKSKVVKATSPILSQLVFIACYSLYLAAAFRTYIKGYNADYLLFSIFCNLEIWLGAIGMALIFATVMVRMFRLYYVFTHFGRGSKYWQDTYLFFYTLLALLFPLGILSVWAIVDTVHKRIPDSPPFFTQCYSDHLGIWLGVLFCYLGLLIFIVLFFAIWSRKIKRSEFKDTKKVSTYIYIVVVTTAAAMTLWYSFMVIGADTLSHVALTSGFLFIGLFCQLLLYAPKTFPLCFAKCSGKKKGVNITSTAALHRHQYSMNW